jgi:hypothetical protein
MLFRHFNEVNADYLNRMINFSFHLFSYPLSLTPYPLQPKSSLNA